MHQASVIKRECRIGGVLIISSVRTHAGKSDGEAGFPAVTHEVVKMGSECNGFVFPVGETEEGADADATEPTSVGALGAV